MRTQVKQLDFSGQNIYVGIDAHLKSWKVNILGERLHLKSFTQQPDPAQLVKFLKKNYPNATYHCAYEAGFCGFWIHDELKKHQVGCMVVNAADVPTTNKEKVMKTDSRDSLKIARGLREKSLEGIYVPSREVLEHRHLLRMRHSLVKDQARQKNRIKAMLHFYGIPIPDDLAVTRISGRFLNWLKKLEFANESGRFALDILIKDVESKRQLLLSAERQIRKLSRSGPYDQLVKLLLTIPGIGLITAMTLITELVDINRFKTKDHLYSYIGLVPGMHSSGEKEVMGEITQRGKKRLRSMLIESAWIAARNDPAMTMTFNELSKHMAKNKAIIRITRKLINRVRYVWKNQEPYVSGVVQ